MRSKLTLYKITIANGNIYYSLAANPTKAYSQIREGLDEANRHYSGLRDLKTLEVLASEACCIGSHPDLYIQEARE